MMAEPVLVENHAQVMVIRLNRPEVHNALSSLAVNALSRICDEMAADNQIRAVVFSGAGDKAFSAGADLKERQGLSEAQTLVFVETIQRTFQKIAELPMPTIAAINGNAFGGGLELALACDIRVMSEQAQVGLTECSLGIIPGAGGTQRLPRIVGFARAMELIFLAKRISAREALAMGLTNHLAADGKETETLALNLAEIMAKNAPLALRAAKEAILVSQEKGIRDGLVCELASYHEILDSHDRREGLKAFLEKRPAQFTGT
jgi:methylglutaconyl-CoA hydratase